MNFNLTSFAFGAVLAISGGTAGAVTIGNAVTSTGDDVVEAETIGGAAAAERTTLVDLAGIGAAASDVIGYFIPLTGGACVFGEDCGTEADTGTGGGPMSLFLEFVNVTGGDSTLSLWFEDLDLMGANDPTGFFESVSIFDNSSNVLASFNSIGDAGISGSAGAQQTAALDLGTLVAGSDYTVRLDFSSSFTSVGTNTPEFLLAAIEGTPASPVPLPAGGLLLIAGLGGLAAMRRWKAAT